MEDWGGKRSIDHYVLGKTLGIGSFGKVKLAVHKETSIKVAIKVLNKKKVQQLDMNDKVWREIKVLQLFAHPHIIRLYEVIDTPTDICVIMEYVSGGELFDYIVAKGRLSEDEARRFFQQIIAGVEYCHEYMVVHRDLKPENLLLDAALNVKIADFGLSNMMKDGAFLKTSCGSPNYAAPEVISGQLYAGSEVDIWSCGVILYALLCGNLPFDDENIANLFKKIKGGVYTMPGYLSEGCRDLIPRMLVVDPLSRISVAQLRQHSWFKCNLPGYLAFPAAVDRTRLVQVGVPKPPPLEALNETVLVEMCRRLDIARNDAVDGLKAQHTNQISVAYNLILDARKAIDCQPLTIRQQQRGDHSADYQEFNQGDPFVSFGVLRDAARPKSPVGEAAGPAGGDTAPDWETAERKAGFFAQGGWQLGLHSSLKPDETMHQILVALQSLGAVWKFHSPYHVKCWFGGNRRGSGGGERGVGGGGAPGAVSVKMSILLYRRRDGYGYVVDLRIAEGGAYQFLAVVRDLAATLKLD